MYRLPPGRSEQARVNKIALAILLLHRVEGRVVLNGYTSYCNAPDRSEQCSVCAFRRDGKGCAVPRIRRVAVLLNSIANRERLPAKLANAAAFVRDVAATEVASFVVGALTAANNAVGGPELPPPTAAAPEVVPVPAMALNRMRRMPAPHGVRSNVWRLWFGASDVGRCYACDVSIAREDGSALTGWHASHIVSDMEDGTWALANLIPQCAQCNTRQSAHPNAVEDALANFPALHRGRKRRLDFPDLPVHMRSLAPTPAAAAAAAADRVIAALENMNIVD